MNPPCREGQVKEVKQQNRSEQSFAPAMKLSIAQTGPLVTAASTVTKTASLLSNAPVALVKDISSAVATSTHGVASSASLPWQKSSQSVGMYSQLSQEDASGQAGAATGGGCCCCSRDSKSGEGCAQCPREAPPVRCGHKTEAAAPKAEDPAKISAVGPHQQESQQKQEETECTSVWCAGDVFDPAGVLLTPCTPVDAGDATPSPHLGFLQCIRAMERHSRSPMRSSGICQAELFSMQHAGTEAYCKDDTARTPVRHTAWHVGSDDETTSCNTQRDATEGGLPLHPESSTTTSVNSAAVSCLVIPKSCGEDEVAAGGPMKQEYANYTPLLPSPQASPFSGAVSPLDENICGQMVAHCLCPQIAEMTGNESETVEELALEELEATERSVSCMPSSLLLGALNDSSFFGRHQRGNCIHCRKRASSHEEAVDATSRRARPLLQERVLDFGVSSVEKTSLAPATEYNAGSSQCCLEPSVESSRNKLFCFSLSSMGAMRFTKHSLVESPAGAAGIQCKRAFQAESVSYSGTEERRGPGPTGNSVSLSGIYMRAPPSTTNIVDCPLNQQSVAMTVMSPVPASLTASASQTQEASIDALFPVLHVPPELRLRPERLVDSVKRASPMSQPPPVACGPLSFTIRSEILQSPQRLDVARHDDDCLAICGHNEGGSPLSGCGCIFRSLWPSPCCGVVQRNENSGVGGGLNSSSGDWAPSPLGVRCPSSRLFELRGGHGCGDFSPCVSPLPGGSSRHHEWKRHEFSCSFKSQANTDVLASLSGPVELISRGGQHTQNCSAPLPIETPTRKHTVYPVSKSNCTFQLPTFGGPPR
ncbi:hypothetical protein TraAM80_09279 [Trypanosoma rangeli]|uniref:Uncharacterized protein n=1 Tax=Trypanosoma rangeli TaxID=5698 RepID=A0A3R7R803_TRYRA|nr:uncharacterized protein TraAM80_09279 [Trypanosoma rangeli]RNE97545.1 hypothetical protein TraAM80_09279 [Trypanosoma rangeli]|eukprot:RNE97545.1 hypothetical protein TraAM80_09279 [Trypanosoma rangeli]